VDRHATIRREGEAALHLLPSKINLLRAPGSVDEAGRYHPNFPYRLSPQIDGGFAQCVGLAYVACRSLSMEPPTHVFASGPVFGNFLVGRHLATHFHVPLCLQYRDEWTVMKPSFVRIPTAIGLTRKTAYLEPIL